MGQVFGLVAVVLGASALKAPKAGRKSSPWPFRIASGLFLLTLAGLLLYHLRVTDQERGRLRANLLRPSVEAGSSVGDASLKTLSFSGQNAHPRGLSTEDLAARRASGEPLRLVDVRESEEVEMGGIPGSTPVRYPDLLATPSLAGDGTATGNPGVGGTVLLCYSGNRSSELSDALAEAGLEAQFLIGGYEKWIAEGRDLDLGRAEDRAELRVLPEWPGDDVLLGTGQVRDLARERGVVFVDVRYPEDFAAGHLPGAVNLPMRKLTTDELEARLSARFSGKRARKS